MLGVLGWWVGVIDVLIGRSCGCIVFRGLSRALLM